VSDALAIYLQDHLAGSVQAIELIESISKQYPGEELGRFAAGLLDEVKSDRETLRGIAQRMGTSSSTVKEATAWFSEKVTLIKLHREQSSGLGTLEALEFLELGIHGKWALWRALEAVASRDSRLEGTDFRLLAERAETQRAQVEDHRIKVAQEILLPRPM
jgi:hypothetical protein